VSELFAGARGPAEARAHCCRCRQFVAVAEDGHIPRAAERLGMQQPLLSQRIKAIETELDVKLFRRKARGVELTEAGRVFFDRARAMIAQYEGSFEATRRRRAASRVGSDVGVMPTAPFHPFVPFVIRAFRAAFPLVSLTLDECLRKEALERLRDDQMDVAFMRAAMDESQNLSVNPLLSSRWWWRCRAITQWRNVSTVARLSP
jgi:DNA-binding transcriptional LysR family regulator